MRQGEGGGRGGRRLTARRGWGDPSKVRSGGTRTSAHLRYEGEEGGGGERGTGRRAEEEGKRGVGVGPCIYFYLRRPIKIESENPLGQSGRKNLRNGLLLYILFIGCSKSDIL